MSSKILWLAVFRGLPRVVRAYSSAGSLNPMKPVRAYSSAGFLNPVKPVRLYSGEGESASGPSQFSSGAQGEELR